MRLPGRPGDSEKPHFLTTFYTEELFKLEVVDFVNSNDNTFLKFYNKPLMQRKGGENHNIYHITRLVLVMVSCVGAFQW